MNYKLIIILFSLIFVYGCNNQNANFNKKDEFKIKNRYINKGFTHVFNKKIDKFKKLDERSLDIYHKFLKKNSNDYIRLDNSDYMLFLKNLKKLGFSEIDLKKSFSQNKKIINAFHRHFIPKLLNKYPRIISYKTLQEIINLTFNE